MALSKAISLPPIPEEGTNFLRFANLLIRISPKAVRVLFDKYFQPCGLHVVLTQSKRKLEGLNRKKILNKSQMDLLYPLKGMKLLTYIVCVNVIIGFHFRKVSTMTGYVLLIQIFYFLEYSFVSTQNYKSICFRHWNVTS